MIPTPSNEFIEETTIARRKQILGILPKKMLESMCDQEHRPHTFSRVKLLNEALSVWEDNTAEIAQYLDRAFVELLTLTY